MTAYDILRHAVQARVEARRLDEGGQYKLAALRRRDAAALKAMLRKTL